MSALKTIGLENLKVDTANLYREEVYTDLGVATIRRLMPIKADGSADSQRDCIFTAQTNIMTPAGLLPVQCEIDAKTLQEAIEKFPGAIKRAIEDMMAEIDEFRRQQASRIVVAQPGQIPAAAPGRPAPGKEKGGIIQLG